MVALIIIITLMACVKISRPPVVLPTQNTVPCEKPGTVGSGQVLHPSQGFEISFNCYLPPCYDDQQDIRYPVIYLITVPADSHIDSSQNTPMSLADRLIHEGKMPPVIIVIPNDVVALGYESALAIDLVPYIDETFNTIQDSRFRSVGGISHGGAEAARMAFKFPDMFGSVGILSGGIVTQEQATFDQWIAATPTDNLPRVRIDIGDKDTIMPLTQNLIYILDKHQVPYLFSIGKGQHNWEFWSSVMESYLLWFAEAWQ